MPIKVPSFHLDALSFWLGIITASLFWWFVSGFRKLWPSIKFEIQARTSDAHAMAANNIEERIRRETVRQAQGSHLAFPLFSLDEILVTPRLLAPPTQAAPQQTMPAPEDLIAQTVTYTPDWPELAACYHTAALEIYEPLATCNYLAITGQPGCGKTTALSYLTCLIARRECPNNELNALLPIYLHALDLPIPYSSSADVAKTIIDLVGRKAPPGSTAQVPALIRDSLTGGKVLLILDGIDELPAAGVRDVCNFLGMVIKAFPDIRIAVAAAPEYWDGLTGLGFHTFALAHWDDVDIHRFLDQWGARWVECIDPLAQDKKPGIDPLVMENWLSTYPASYTPFDWTLIAWSAFAGDTTSPRPAAALEAYFQRGIDRPQRNPIQQIALQMALHAQPSLAKSEIQAALESQLKVQSKPVPIDEKSEAGRTDPQKGTGGDSQKASPVAMPVRFLVENGIFTEQAGDRLRFSHPLMAAYLAACALSANPQQASHLISQPGWPGKFETLRYLGSLIDISRIVEPFLADVEEPLYRNTFAAARWLKDCRESPAWKIRVMRSLVEMIQSESLSTGVRQRALTAVVCSADASLPTLFKQLLGSKTISIIQLAALGGGAIHDERLGSDLIGLLKTTDGGIATCCCMALVAIGAQAGIEEVARALLTGNEGVRRAAAESLSNHPAEGYAVLKDGSVLNDLLLRRAVVFGLARIKEKWATETLEKMRIEDGQWVVRNAAAQALEEMGKPNPRIPKLLPPPAQSPWLVAFAAKQGKGIGGNSPAIDVLLLALKMGDQEERLAALDYLRMTPKEEVIAGVFEMAYHGREMVREMAINTLYEYAASGVTLPAPAVFGLGKASPR